MDSVVGTDGHAQRHQYANRRSHHAGLDDVNRRHEDRRECTIGPLGLNPDEAGNYALQVTVTDGIGQSTSSTVHVNATSPTLGLRNVPVGIPAFLQGDGSSMATTAPLGDAGAAPPQGTWSWTLAKVVDSTGAPVPSTATLMNPTTQFPSFTPDVAATYVITETASNQTLSIYAGTWVGEMDTTPVTTSNAARCALCHANPAIDQATELFAPWRATKHYSALQRELTARGRRAFQSHVFRVIRSATIKPRRTTTLRTWSLPRAGLSPPRFRVATGRRWWRIRRWAHWRASSVRTATGHKRPRRPGPPKPSSRRALVAYLVVLIGVRALPPAEPRLLRTEPVGPRKTLRPNARPHHGHSGK